MKELSPTFDLSNQDKVEIGVKKRQQVEYVLEGTIKPNKGHFIWEVNTLTGDVCKAKFKKTIFVLGAMLPPEELIINPDCLYIPALNEKNARKHYLKNSEQSNYFVKPPIMNLSDITF